jgi:hypothetical protein
MSSALLTGSDQELMAEAATSTGLSDFGDTRFVEGLQTLLRAYDQEARLNAFGSMAVRQEILGILAARLSLIEEWKQQAQALTAPVKRPLFVLGLPRTGTSALHDLLAEDPRHQVLEYFMAASPRPRTLVPVTADDPRLVAARRELDGMYSLDPGLRALHDMRADGPEECRHLFRHHFTDDTFDSMAAVPGYTAWFRAQSMAPAYDWHRLALALVQSTAPDRRWVLKYPAHLRNLAELFRVYPDACVVQTHRDPLEVLPSLCTLVYRLRSLYSDHVDPHAVGRWQLEMWAHILEQSMAFRSRHDAAQFHDVYFADFQRDPVATIRSIHSHFGDTLDEASADRIRVYRAAHPPGRYGRQVYRLEDFGLTQDMVRERYSEYREAFGFR